MMMKYSTLLAAGLLLAACDPKSDTGSDGEDSGVTDTTDDGVTPEEGDWYGGEETVTEDTCGFEDDGKDTDEDTPVVLTLTGETTFTLNDGDGFEQSCTFDSSAGTFTCEPIEEITDFTKKGLDAIITFTQNVSGTFSTSTTGVVDVDMDVTCEGTDCDTVAKYGGLTLPCSIAFNLDITHGG